MKTKAFLSALMLGLVCTSSAVAQIKAPASAPRADAPPRHEPPAQAYADCKGKKTGDAIQHTTPEGTVAATCEDSPKGLVARPRQPRDAPPDGRTK